MKKTIRLSSIAIVFLIVVLLGANQSIAAPQVPDISWEELNSHIKESQLEPYSIPCENPGCRGTIRRIVVGYGNWWDESTEFCKVHHNCVIATRARNVYKEEFCTGTCGLVTPYTDIEYKTTHYN